MPYPLTFRPIFKERVWGGRNLERLYGKPLPRAAPIGESWEISDRPGEVSVISNGPLAGKDLHWLVEHRAEELLGPAKLQNGRFPLLIKLLDAQDKLSLQVHPPAPVAVKLGGEPKTEMWYVADAAPGAELFVGFKRGTTRAEVERKIRDGSVADCFHHFNVRAGDAMFLPSGRVHAIGAGLVLFEIQQNSDTTYRVFDWNRAGLDGKPRELHVTEALASIDFHDYEPELVRPKPLMDSPHLMVEELVDDRSFTVKLYRARSERHEPQLEAGASILALLRGQLIVSDGANDLALRPGQFCLLPACLKRVALKPATAATFLEARPR